MCFFSPLDVRMKTGKESFFISILIISHCFGFSFHSLLCVSLAVYFAYLSISIITIDFTRQPLPLPPPPPPLPPPPPPPPPPPSRPQNGTRDKVSWSTLRLWPEMKHAREKLYCHANSPKINHTALVSSMVLNVHCKLSFIN